MLQQTPLRLEVDTLWFQLTGDISPPENRILGSPVNFKRDHFLHPGYCVPQHRKEKHQHEQLHHHLAILCDLLGMVK